MFAVVAPGEEAKPFPCPICKGPMKREFLEEDEECIWKNVMKKDEKVRFLRHNHSKSDADIPADLPHYSPR